MPAFRRKRRGLGDLTSVHREDPLSGVANLFDASIVFAVGLMVALVQAFGLTQLLDPDAEVTITTKNPRTGQLEIVEKNRTSVTVRKVTEQKQAGEGTRLGVAYQLPNGTIVYVPEGSAP